MGVEDLRSGVVDRDEIADLVDVGEIVLDLAMPLLILFVDEIIGLLVGVDGREAGLAAGGGADGARDDRLFGAFAELRMLPRVILEAASNLDVVDNPLDC